MLGLATTSLVSCENSSEDTAAVTPSAEEATFSELNTIVGIENIGYTSQVTAHVQLQYRNLTNQRIAIRAINILRQRNGFRNFANRHIIRRNITRNTRNANVRFTINLSRGKGTSDNDV